MIVIKESRLAGEIKIQPSKSAAHRAVICGALSGDDCKISNIALSDDIKATLGAVRDLGFCDYEIMVDTCLIKPVKPEKKREIFCNESGSTLRFCIPLGMDGEKHIFTGKGRLMQRPQQPYEDICRKKGIYWKQGENGIEVCGKLESGIYKIRGDISSQFISGLLFALPTLKEDSRIEFTTKLESKGYVDLTLDMQKKFGVNCEFDGDGINIKGNQKYTPCDIKVEGDYSHAAFFAVAGALGGDVTATDLDEHSLQGDAVIFDILKRMGANVEGTRVFGGELKGIDIDVSQIPDLVPVLCVAACGAKGKTRIYNAARLRMKESDRLAAMAQELKKLGADVTEFEDAIEINGRGTLEGGEVDSHADHRIAMSMAVASCIAKGDIKIHNHNVVSKSAPDFYKEFISLGGNAVEQ